MEMPLVSSMRPIRRRGLQCLTSSGVWPSLVGERGNIRFHGRGIDGVPATMNKSLVELFWSAHRLSMTQFYYCCKRL